jgi:hypothetical protein
MLQVIAVILVLQVIQAQVAIVVPLVIPDLVYQVDQVIQVGLV